MQDQLNVYMKCYKDKYHKALKSDESICVSFRDFNTYYNIDDDWNSLRYLRSCH
jgi:hypothetical protein